MTQITTSVVLQRHIDAAFNAFDLDESGKLYLSDALIALDSLLAACWGKDAAASSATGNNNKQDGAGGSNNKPTQAEIAVAQSGSGVSAEALSLPGVSRSKILQALKSALHKAGADPDASVSGAAPIITKELFGTAAETLLAPLPNVQREDVDAFAAFQSLNQSADLTRVNRRALRRALFAEYDNDVYATQDEEDELDARLRSGSAASMATSNKSSPTAAASSSSSSAATGQALKFDGVRNMIGCDELLLSRFAFYKEQGLSFDEWRKCVAPQPPSRKPPRVSAAAVLAAREEEEKNNNKNDAAAAASAPAAATSGAASAATQQQEHDQKDKKEEDTSAASAAPNDATSDVAADAAASNNKAEDVSSSSAIQSNNINAAAPKPEEPTKASA